MSNTVKKAWGMQLLLLLAVGILMVAVTMWDYAGTPELSRKSGFYKEPFLLEISAGNAAKIYYTLDGSEPDETSLLYTAPIRIADATPNPNRDSMRTDTSAGFYADLLDKYQNGEKVQYTAPDYPVDKCTIVRAVAVNPSGKCSDVSTATYFVGISPEKYNGCNILSLITDPDNLFDSETGIYVTGRLFDEYLEANAEALESGELEEYWQWWGANYREKGSQWERPVLLEFFDSSGSLVLSKNCGTRIRGGVSRGMLPRGLNFYCRPEYDGTDSFGLALLGGHYDPQRISLNSGGNAVITQFPDYMMSHMVQDLNLAVMSYDPYVLFINGEYWGFYWMSQKYDAQYVSHFYNVPAENVVMIKNWKVEEGQSKDYELFEEMRHFIYENDMSQKENYEKACSLIDMDSYVDYYATMIYIARTGDWPGANFALWRARNPQEDSLYADGKWRWMLFDCNSASMEASLLEHDTLNDVLDGDKVFHALWQNPDFRALFQQRILEIGRTLLSGERVDAFIQDYQEYMVPALEKSWARFYGSENTKYSIFSETMESHRTFFNGRYAVVSSWFE